MNKRRFLISTALLIAAPAQLLAAHTIELPPLSISHPWMVYPNPGEDNAVGYMKITNNGAVDAKLLNAASFNVLYPSLRESRVEDNVIKHRPMPDGIVIPAGKTVEFSETSYNIFFKDLDRKFEVGESLEVVLTFENIGPVWVEFEVTEKP